MNALTQIKQYGEISDFDSAFLMGLAALGRFIDPFRAPRDAG